MLTTKRMKSLSFEASLIKLYLYCPNIPYLILNLGVKESITEMMVEGKIKHERILKKMREKGWKTNVFLKSKKYRIHGYVDAFKKEENGYVVVELKNTNYRKEIVKMHLYQAACYALMVEENFGRVYKVVIKYNDREVDFPFTLGIKKYCVSIINKIHRIAKGELISYRIDKTKCENCGFFKFCKSI